MKFLDANVFLFARLDEGSIGEAARRLLRKIDGENPAATSTVVLNEVFWNLRKPLGRGEALDRSRQLSIMPGLRILAVGDREWVRALDLMTNHERLKPNDAIHAASCIEAGIESIVSTDEDFDGIAGLRREAVH